VVSYFGAHGRANRLGQLLDAAELLRADGDVRLLLVGDGMEKPALVADAARRGLDNVIFCDPVPKTEVADYVNASDACTAVLMRNDTFKTVYPNKVFDYMSCKRPVILAVDGVARELVEQARAGVYVEPENAEAFAAAVRHLKANPAAAREMGESGFRFVQEHFSREKLAEQYRELLERLGGMV
jgi:glycosyltransferase involved in cell wall biosynthesis